MSIRTIVEFNHDFKNLIEQNPDNFMYLLLTALSGSEEDKWEALWKYGVRHESTKD